MYFYLSHKRLKKRSLMTFSGFAKPLGLLALLSLIPFLILHLRRPKPKDQVIPSLMFIIKDQQKVKRFSFFRHLVSNLMFFIQLLALIGLSIAAAAPFIKLPYDTTLENTVIVIDVSASMQAKDLKTGITRFENALEIAKKSLSGKNSIVLAENAPLIALEDEDTDIALKVLEKITPKATGTNLGDALLLAKDILGEKPGRIVLISDFASTEGPDVKVVKTAISSEDKIIDFIDVTNNAENVGIIRLESNKFNTKVYIKNFNNEEKAVTIKITKGGKQIASSEPIRVGPKSIENFIFDTVEGITKVELLPRDGLDVDNFVYLATPPKLRYSVLLITNEKNSNLEYALSAAKDIKLNVVNPPVITITTKKEKVEPFKHDVIIVYRINNVNKKDGILPGTFSDLNGYVEDGGNIVVAAQDDLKDINMQSLPIVDLKSIVSKPSKVCVDTINQLTKQFQKEGCFTTVSKYYGAALKKGHVAFASSDDKTPIIAFIEHKKGKVVYYGIFDDASEFKTLPSYPIFWDTLINFLVEAEEIKDYTLKSGKIVAINEQSVKTPSASFTTSRLLMDEVGIYEYDNKKFAVNLLDEKESDVTAFGTEKQKAKEELIKKEKREREFNLELLIIALAFLLIAAEIVIVKTRGEL